ncbi:fructosamine kinase family protein [Pelagibaculum spongiae]|uniref:fructosamine kinase family protein n=1 Tax=Pelagibaculum spongiae TaxID=2080658 RepID=UPI001314F669|nr:fructosamine kinase family protein [Pelagibaculum spongiae]
MKKLAKILSQARQEPIELSSGIINQGAGSQTRQLIGHTGKGQLRFLLKTTCIEKQPMLVAEANNLRQLKQTSTIRVPEVIWCGEASNEAVLLVEWLDFQSAGNWQQLAKKITELHRYPVANDTSQQPAYGWADDNYLGENLQKNGFKTRWCDFFAEQRIGVQLEQAARNNFVLGSVNLLIDQVRKKLSDHQPDISLVHGDFWSGNVGFCHKSPVIYDPACYYGDRETDFAMASLFGGFSPQFFSCCQQDWPLPAGWENRRVIYNLYHLLNHLNLFGSHWEADVHKALQQLLATTESA